MGKTWLGDVGYASSSSGSGLVKCSAGAAQDMLGIQAKRKRNVGCLD